MSCNLWCLGLRTDVSTDGKTGLASGLLGCSVSKVCLAAYAHHGQQDAVGGPAHSWSFQKMSGFSPKTTG